MSEHVVLVRHGAVQEIRLQRPEKRNALSAEMYLALCAALQGASQDAAVHVVLLEGQPGAFCAGNELESFLEPAEITRDHPVFRFMAALATCGKPIVAAVDGMAVGIGATLLLHCDLVYATARSRLVFPFARLGLCPEFGSSLLLARCIGRVAAAEALLLGEPVSADRARQWGLINEILPEAALHDHALNRAQALAVLPAQAVQVSRQLIRTHAYPELPAVMAAEAEQFLAMLAQPAVQQGFRDFLTHRTHRT